MNKDQVQGRYEEAKGKIKEVAGDVLRDDLMKTEGNAQKIAGKVQAGVGDLKEKVRKGG